MMLNTLRRPSCFLHATYTNSAASLCPAALPLESRHERSDTSPSAASARPFVKTLGLYASQSCAFIKIVYRVLATPWPEIANAQGDTFMLSRHQSFEL